MGGEAALFTEMVITDRFGEVVSLHQTFSDEQLSALYIYDPQLNCYEGVPWSSRDRFHAVAGPPEIQY